MASSTAKVSFRIFMVILILLVLFYVGRPLYWKISATVHDIRHNKQTVKQGTPLSLSLSLSLSLLKPKNATVFVPHFRPNKNASFWGGFYFLFLVQVCPRSFSKLRNLSGGTTTSPTRVSVMTVSPRHVVFSVSFSERKKKN